MSIKNKIRTSLEKKLKSEPIRCCDFHDGRRSGLAEAISIVDSIPEDEISVSVKNKELLNFLLDEALTKETSESWKNRIKEDQKDTKIYTDNEDLRDEVIREIGRIHKLEPFNTPWVMDSTGVAYPYHYAKVGACWQDKKDKKWLADNHKKIFNNGYEEGFEAGRDDIEDQILKDSVELEVKEYGDGEPYIIFVPDLKKRGYKGGDKIKIVIIKDE